MRSKVTYIILCFLFCRSFSVVAQQIVSVNGLVRDEQTKEALAFATIQLIAENNITYGAITDAKGHYQFSNLAPGTYTIVISYLGYDQVKKEIRLSKKQTLTTYLHASSTSLDEVVVTASESKGLTSASKIDRTAMAHLQPSSFTDLLELLPGGKSVDPDMGSANLIRIREAGSTNEGIASQGVSFHVDGISLQTDANLQYVPGSTSIGAEKESVSKGMDMRTISTDNIESVEIVRGMPSVEYGNLTGGIVLIKRKSTQTPFSARFKTDQYSKLFSAGKGVGLKGGKDILNLDLSYLDSRIDPRDSRENYKRITGSTRWHATRAWGENSMKWNINADYTGSFDNIKRDKDITAREDRYRSSYDKWSIGGEWLIKFSPETFTRQLRARASFSQEFNKIEETKSIFLDRPTAVTLNREQGESDGLFLSDNYIANMVIDGKPQYANVNLSGEFGARWLNVQHTIKAGVDWSSSKNRGEGQVYDLTRPLNTSFGLRPRTYKEIPALEKASFYLEENMSLPLGEHQLNVVAGVRGFSLLHLDEKYRMKGKLYVDPRFNLQWRLPALGSNNDWFLTFSASLGWLSMSPGMAQLYPDMKYADIAQLNYYNNDPNYRRINFMTHKWDQTNYELTPARNRKWEVRFDLSHSGNNLSVTYFRERMNNAFRNISYYRILPYKKYDNTSIDGSELTAPPALEDFTYTDDALINVYSKVGNGTRMRKEGVEFTFSSKRIQLLKTRITINGAWLKTLYSNAMPTYQSASILLNGEQLKYIGLYDWEDGTEKQLFNTNFMLDTYLQRLGMTISASAQCTWMTSTRNLWNNGLPVSYIGKDGVVHPFTQEDEKDAQLQHLVNEYPDSYFNRNTIPFEMQVNLKATKKIGRYVHLALFVNRLLSVSPDYYRNEQLIRRSYSPYFGMEMNLSF